jgi:hypothetical protein
MALGYPETKTLVFEGDQKTETWLWGGGKKVLTLRGGRVVSLHDSVFLPPGKEGEHPH